MTETQKRRRKSATWLVAAASKDKRTAGMAKQWTMQADAADRRVEKRKGRPSPTTTAEA